MPEARKDGMHLGSSELTRAIEVIEPEEVPEAKTEGEAGSPAEPLTLKTVTKGLAVQLQKDTSAKGVVVRKAGKNVQVNFSQSGGEAAKWVACADLEHATDTTDAQQPTEAVVDEPSVEPEPGAQARDDTPKSEPAPDYSVMRPYQLKAECKKHDL